LAAAIDERKIFTREKVSLGLVEKGKGK